MTAMAQRPGCTDPGAFSFLQYLLYYTTFKIPHLSLLPCIHFLSHCCFFFRLLLQQTFSSAGCEILQLLGNGMISFQLLYAFLLSFSGFGQPFQIICHHQAR
jgi:hypothetical protein